MIEELLHPLVCGRFKTDPHYREGHLRIINALPGRLVLGLHAPEMKQIAKQISKHGCQVALPTGGYKICKDGRQVISCFEAVPEKSLCYEETVIWGFLINLQKSPLERSFEMLSHYVPVLDNWAVCDSFCAHAKWMKRADKELLWSFLQQWFNSENEFEVRFAVVASMCCFLEEEWLDRLFEIIDNLDFEKIRSRYITCSRKPEQPQQGTVQGAEPYYVRMGVAWLLATALAKFPDRTCSFASTSNLPEDVLGLYVRKARESFRTREINPFGKYK